MAATGTDSAASGELGPDPWHARYEELRRTLADRERELAAANARNADLAAFHERYATATASRSWRLMEASWRLMGRLRARPSTDTEPDRTAPAVISSESSPAVVRIEDTWDYDVEAERHLTMGRYSYFKPRVIVFPGDVGHVYVGHYSSIFYDVDVFAGGNHSIDFVSTYAFRQRFYVPGRYEDGIPSGKGDVHIGSDVWVGKGAMILSGVSIGDGAVVGARAVVARDVRPYAVVVGNPAREVKRRFTDDVVEALLRIRWWDWPDDLVQQRIRALSGGPVEEFIAHYA